MPFLRLLLESHEAAQEEGSLEESHPSHISDQLHSLSPNLIVMMHIVISAGVVGVVGIVGWKWRWSFRRPLASPRSRSMTGREEIVEVDASGPNLSLEVVSGSPVKVKIQALHNGPPVTIGRLSSNTLTIVDDHVSGEHVRLHWDESNKQWMMRDSGSMNGTELNGKNITAPNRKPGEEHTVKAGDVITLVERIKINVEQLVDPCGSHSTVVPEKYSDKVSPRSGSINDPGPQTAISLFNNESPGQKPKPHSLEFYVPGLHAEFAIASQVGMSHWQLASGSQDVAFWETPFSKFQKSGLFAVCDGHVGDTTSKELLRVLPQTLQGRFTNNASLFEKENDMQQLLEEYFPSLDRELKTQDGSTCTIMLAERLESGECALVVANVGDSTGILVEEGRSETLTEDHRVVSKAETERLNRDNTPITHGGTRAYTLNLARAMGDHHLKAMNTSLIADPFVSKVIKVRPNQTSTVLIASDGLWDGIDKGEVLHVLTKGSKEGTSLTESLVTLINQSASKDISDDITVAVVRFLPMSVK